VARDVAGRPHTIHVYTDQVSAGDSQGSPGTIHGQTTLRTDAGEVVHRVGEGHYRVKATGLLLWSYSPDAY
jgi:hypothetical protein